MKKIAVVTSTRAEYGLLRPVILELRKREDSGTKVELIVTGTHLSKEYGYTINEIINDKLRIDHKIKIPTDSGSPLDISNNQSEALIEFTKLFTVNHYDALTLLGDRYETLAIAIAALNTHIPIIHLCGGDISEGAIDEYIRHAITKLSYLHFVTNDGSRRRVIQMGESPDRVFNYGSTSIDNAFRIATLSKQEALESVGMNDCKYAVCTYHPVTLGKKGIHRLMVDFSAALMEFPQIEFIITKSNADQGGQEINDYLEELEKKEKNIHVFSSLGVKRYLSLVKYSEVVIGNSSSGIIEAPAFNVPTVNIGDRQKGRLRQNSIIDCEDSTLEVRKAIEKALSADFRRKCNNNSNPYGDGNASIRISGKIMEFIKENTDRKKQFYCLD